MRKPNFIVILADDLGYGDVGCNGSTHIRTPNIDRLAAEGARFTDFYASANVCTPSRAGLLTGRYAIRSGLAHEVLQPDDTKGLPLAEVTIPRALKPDYATALFGKWHLGHVAPHFPPTNYGFDRFYGVPYSHDMRPLQVYEADGDTLTPHDGRVDMAKLTQQFFEQAMAFAEASRDRPFFILLALMAPHIPLVPNPDDPTDSAGGAYGDVVEEIDLNIGRLLAKLKALGLDDDTMVAFTSDNGPWFEGSSGPFRDRKGGGAWDGAFRVPFVARLPSRIPAGTVAGGLSSNLDILPTLLSLAGLQAPAGLELDGLDVSDQLTGGEGPAHEEILLFNNNHVAGLRTERWKLVARSYYRTYDAPLDALPLLFDMQADPGETYSVARLNPEALADMRERLARARARYEPMAAAFPPHQAPASAADHPD
ncbi:MAG: sulfatase-like hydrolase/transferase [Phenylobacterium sp.]|uniref:sulfatase-like hydrolase/transferase n=1 Tax=Phenylobacterium sp. TaxID=1871053 RepID=UPI001A4F56E6|nr:sulfatase-like hydrolase/transferase [Phenylobacterium sp.]MBL8556254.1 sulfatase-like hydrolase/transferase [Phenylobacterium sp.]